MSLRLQERFQRVAGLHPQMMMGYAVPHTPDIIDRYEFKSGGASYQLLIEAYEQDSRGGMDGSLVGELVMGTLPDHFGEDVWIVSTIHVDPAYRNRGIAKGLHSAFHEAYPDQYVLHAGDQMSQSAKRLLPSLKALWPNLHFYDEDELQLAKTAGYYNEDLSPDDRLGKCYEMAARWVMDQQYNTRAKVIHGSIQGGGHPRISHAWVELGGGDVFEAVSGAHYSGSEFRFFFRAEVEHEYTQNEVRDLILIHEHWGPWDTMKHARRTVSKTAEVLDVHGNCVPLAFIGLGNDPAEVERAVAKYNWSHGSGVSREDIPAVAAELGYNTEWMIPQLDEPEDFRNLSAREFCEKHFSGGDWIIVSQSAMGGSHAYAWKNDRPVGQDAEHYLNEGHRLHKVLRLT